MSEENMVDTAALVADKQARGEAKEWGPFKKETTEIPKRMIGVSFAILQPKAGETADETWENILAFCGGDHKAALDTFNSAYRLDNQKALKARFKDTVDKDGNVTAEALEVPELQELSNAHVATQTTRGSGSSKGSAKAKVAAAEAKASAAMGTMEALLADLEASDPEKAAAYRERLAALQG